MCDLPDLTPTQSTALGYLLTSTLSLLETADEAGMKLGEFVITLMHPDCQAHLAAVTQIHDQRAKARAAEAKTKAIDTLEHIAEDARPPTDKLELFHRMERRRAAAAILRFGIERKREPRPERPPDPTDDPAARTTQPPAPDSPSTPTLTDHLATLTPARGLARRPVESFDTLLHLADADECAGNDPPLPPGQHREPGNGETPNPLPSLEGSSLIAGSGVRRAGRQARLRDAWNNSDPEKVLFVSAPQPLTVSSRTGPTPAPSLSSSAARARRLDDSEAPERAKAPHDQHPPRSSRERDAQGDIELPQLTTTPAHTINVTKRRTESARSLAATQRAPPP
jgi:hypothetical protein